jgi:aspartate kinase
VKARLAAAVEGLSADDEAIGALSVVGTGLSAGHRVLQEVTAAIAALGAAPRAVFTSALRVTVYCDAGVLKDAARAVHEKLIG